MLGICSNKIDVIWGKSQYNTVVVKIKNGKELDTDIAPIFFLSLTGMYIRINRRKVQSIVRTLIY